MSSTAGGVPVLYQLTSGRLAASAAEDRKRRGRELAEALPADIVFNLFTVFGCSVHYVTQCCSDSKAHSRKNAVEYVPSVSAALQEPILLSVNLKMCHAVADQHTDSRSAFKTDSIDWRRPEEKANHQNSIVIIALMPCFSY